MPAEGSRAIAFAGGGSAGHVIPNLAVAEACRRRGRTCVYLGLSGGVEERLARRAGLRFYAVPSAPLRRYADARNVSAPFVLAAGLLVALWRLVRVRPSALFAKGGYAACAPYRRPTRTPTGPASSACRCEGISARAGRDTGARSAVG